MRREPITFERDVALLQMWAREQSLRSGTRMLRIIKQLADQTSPNVRWDVRQLKIEAQSENFYRGKNLTRMIVRLGKYARNGKSVYE